MIDRLLDAMGWDIRDPDEVQLEYPTVDGKFVDYALKLNKKATLLIEAKALDDPLLDVKAITQVAGYSANDGIVWCILTNGLKWRIYRSVEKCSAPEKLMFEVCLDPDESEGMTIQQIARQMWRFSPEELAKGTLDTLGEQTFTDGKVRKALQKLIIAPPRSLLNLLSKTVDGDNLTIKQIRNSLTRIASDATFLESPAVPAETVATAFMEEQRVANVTKKSRQGEKNKKTKSSVTEEHHVTDKPREIVQLYRALDRICFSFSSGNVVKRYMAKSINYEINKSCFCSVHLRRSGLRVWLRPKYKEIAQPPTFARDVASVGHWGVGDLELRICTRSELDESAPLIRKSFESRK